MSSTSQVTTFADLYTDLQNRVRITTGVSATEVQAKRYINVALQDINLGFQYKLPWLERQGQLRTHAPYTTGTVSITIGSTSVTGSSTLWNTLNSYEEANARTTGKLLFEGGADVYPIASVTTDTAIVLNTRFVGSDTLSGATYTYFEDTYDLASDFLRPVDFQFFSQAYGVDLIPRDEFRRRFPKMIMGKPRYACILDMAPNANVSPVRRVQFYPYPSDTLVIPYNYVTNAVGVTINGAALTSLSTDTDEPLLPLRYRHAIVYHALYHWYRDKRDDSRSQEAKAEYTDIMLRIVDDQDFGAPTKMKLRPQAGMYTSHAQRPYRRGGGTRYDIGGRFDRGY